MKICPRKNYVDALASAIESNLLACRDDESTRCWFIDPETGELSHCETDDCWFEILSDDLSCLGDASVVDGMSDDEITALSRTLAIEFDGYDEMVERCENL